MGHLKWKISLASRTILVNSFGICFQCLFEFNHQYSILTIVSPRAVLNTTAKERGKINLSKQVKHPEFYIHKVINQDKEHDGNNYFPILLSPLPNFIESQNNMLLPLKIHTQINWREVPLLNCTQKDSWLIALKSSDIKPL